MRAGSPTSCGTEALIDRPRRHLVVTIARGGYI
jgi:hypothetical protein